MIPIPFLNITFFITRKKLQYNIQNSTLGTIRRDTFKKKSRVMVKFQKELGKFFVKFWEEAEKLLKIKSSTLSCF